MRLWIICLLMVFNGCKEQTELTFPGNFEAEETMVSAGSGGRIADMRVVEGSSYKKGEVLGHIDTSLLHLQKLKVKEEINALRAEFPDMPAQLSVLRQKRESLERELLRAKRLTETGSASEKMADAIRDNIEVVNKEIAAMSSALNRKTQAILARVDALEVHIKLIEQQIMECLIENPADGVVLEQFFRKYEHVSAGTPLYKIADMSKMIFSCWVTGDNLGLINLGDTVKIEVDLTGNRSVFYDGVIETIADKPQFTPSNVLTRDNRTGMYYRVKIGVKNDGLLKPGMPGEMRLRDEALKN